MLPLLFDTSAAQMGMPWLNLPRGLYHYPEDAKAQVDMAIEYHKSRFGGLPAGMWPAEGSYSEQVIPIISGAGIQWIASGQTNLANSLHLMDGRSKDAPLAPQELYFPWLIGKDKNGLRMVFRDRALSNKIGYEYQSWKAEDAVNNFFGDIQGIRNAFLQMKDERPPLINVILDGENWQEFYHRNAFDFLSQLYDRLGQDPQIVPTTVSAYLGKYDFAPSNILTKQWAGSWAGGTFDTWIGAKRANIAWQFLAKTRGTIKLYQGSSCHETPEWKERIAEALHHLYIAEASDWYWWYGEKHHSEDDSKYDFLYRRHLMYAYSALGLKPPPEMTWPIRENISPDEKKSPEYLSRHAPKKGIAPKGKRKPRKEVEIPYIIKKLGIFEMEGPRFESYLVDLFRRRGYKAERITHDDIGADLILRKDGKKIAVQAKRYKKAVGMDAVRAVIGALKPLECQAGMVVTTAKFTYRAKRLAKDNGVELWDGERLAIEISKAY